MSEISLNAKKSEQSLISEELLSLDVNEIKECLPHRYPML